MSLLLTDDSVFLHIPKTGGTWVTRVLREAGLVRFRFSHKHADLERTLRFGHYYRFQYLKRTLRGGLRLEARVRGAYKFCFVRHPVAWYRSFFKYMQRLDWKRHGGIGGDPWHPNAPLYDLRADSFAGFVERIQQACPGYVSGLYRSFTEGTGPEGIGGVDFVGQQERLNHDLVHVLRHLDLPFDEARVLERKKENVSGVPAKAPLELPPSLAAEVAKTDAWAFERYGYEP
jgi:hypothetical protein